MPAGESKIEKRIRDDIRSIREAAGFSQAAIGELFGWDRQAVSKLENGIVKIRLVDYLRIVQFCREVIPGHPGVRLAEFYTPKRAGREPNPYTTPAD